MHNQKKSQGLSINAIILVAIGLIVLVIIIAILTGRMGLFSKGLESAASCENACKAIGKDNGDMLPNGDCERLVKGTVMPGKYGGDDTKECCCYNNA